MLPLKAVWYEGHMGSMTLPQSGSELKSMTRLTCRDPEDVLDVGEPCCQAFFSERPELPPEAIMTSGPELQSGASSGSLAIHRWGSMLMPVAHVTTKGHVDAPKAMSMSEGCAEQAPPLASPGDVGNGRASPRGMGTSPCSLKAGSALPRSMAVPVVVWLPESWS